MTIPNRAFGAGAAMMIVLLVFSATAAARGLSRSELSRILGCTFHAKGTWVDPEFFPDGRLRFTYLKENARTAYADVFIVFWTSKRDRGKLLHFRASPSTKEYSIVNDGWVSARGSSIDITELFGGVHTYDHLKKLLPGLRTSRMIIVPVSGIRPADAKCLSPLSK
jgi:hypothetical protein